MLTIIIIINLPSNDLGKISPIILKWTANLHFLRTSGHYDYSARPLQLALISLVVQMIKQRIKYLQFRIASEQGTVDVEQNFKSKLPAK